MSTEAFAFSQEDITTVYDALRGCTPELLAEAMLEGGASGCFANRAAHPKAARIATRKAASMLQVLFRLGPNCEASSRVILPWKASHLSQLSHMPWQDALGMRIVMPPDASPETRSRFLASALQCMSYV